MNLSQSVPTLVVQPLPGIGDMVWHLPHLHAIAATARDGRVDVLTKPRSQADRLLGADPAIGRILWLDRSTQHRGLQGVLRLAALLRQGGYQRVWVLHGSARYALAAWLAGIPLRIGYGGGQRLRLLNMPVRLPPAPPATHPIVRANALLDALQIARAEPEPRLSIDPAAAHAIAQRFAAWPRPWIALGIGSSEPWKQWGAARFAELAVALHARRAGSLFIVGGPAERPLADALFAQLGATGIMAADAVALPLEQTVALLAACRAYLGNDTGVLNVAAAVAVPALGLFGASPPLTHSRWIHALQPPAGQQGMAAISVAHVLAAFTRLDESG